MQAVVEATLPGAENGVVAEESADAFRPLLPPDATVSLAGTDASYAVQPAGEVLDCPADTPDDDCIVTDGSVLLTIQGVATGEEPGNEMIAMGLEPGQLMVGIWIRRPRRPPTPHEPTDAPILVLAERDGAWEVVDVLILVP